MIVIPNMEKPESCNGCPIRIGETVSIYYDSRSDEFKRVKITGCDESKYHTKTLGEGYEMMYKDCPLIEIDESEMEYLYKEFGLEKDENLTERAQELKRAILMGYLYAKREIVRCGECIHRVEDSDFQSGHICLKRRSNGGLYCEDNDSCSYGERRKR